MSAATNPIGRPISRPNRLGSFGTRTLGNVEGLTTRLIVGPFVMFAGSFSRSCCKYKVIFWPEELSFPACPLSHALSIYRFRYPGPCGVRVELLTSPVPSLYVMMTVSLALLEEDIEGFHVTVKGQPCLQSIVRTRTCVIIPNP